MRKNNTQGEKMTNENEANLEEKLNMEILKKLDKGMDYIPIKPYLESSSLIAGISQMEMGEDQYSFVTAGNDKGWKAVGYHTGIKAITNQILRNTLGEPERVTSNEEGVEFVFNGYIFQDMDCGDLCSVISKPMGKVIIPFKNFIPYSVCSEEYADLRKRINKPITKQCPDPRVLNECKRILESWANATGNSSNSQNWAQYAAEGRKDIQKALAALERGDYQNAQPIIANLWDAGYEQSHKMGRYTLESLTLIGRALAGKMKPEEFFEKLKRTNQK